MCLCDVLIYERRKYFENMVVEGTVGILSKVVFSENLRFSMEKAVRF